MAPFCAGSAAVCPDMAPGGYSRLPEQAPGASSSSQLVMVPSPVPLESKRQQLGWGVQGEPTALGSCAWVWAALLPLCPTPALSLRSLLREAGTWALYKDGHHFTSLGVMEMPSSLPVGSRSWTLPLPPSLPFLVFFLVCVFVCLGHTAWLVGS